MNPGFVEMPGRFAKKLNCAMNAFQSLVFFFVSVMLSLATSKFLHLFLQLAFESLGLVTTAGHGVI